MRLRYIASVPSEVPFRRLVDPYVPLKLSVGYSVIDPPLYWRLVDPKFSLVEVGVGRRDGRFVSLTVSNYNGELHPLGPERGAAVNETLSALPVFGLEPWPDFRPGMGVDGIRAEFHDIEGRCRLELGGESLRVVLFPDAVARRLLTFGDVVFELNASDELCALTALGLNPEEVEVLNLNHNRA